MAMCNSYLQTGVLQPIQTSKCSYASSCVDSLAVKMTLKGASHISVVPIASTAINNLELHDFYILLV